MKKTLLIIWSLIWIFAIAATFLPIIPMNITKFNMNQPYKATWFQVYATHPELAHLSWDIQKVLVRLDWVTPRNAEFVWSFAVKTADKVYIRDMLIPNADTSSFTSLAIEKYWSEKVISTAILSGYINNEVYYDKNNLYISYWQKIPLKWEEANKKYLETMNAAQNPQ